MPNSNKVFISIISGSLIIGIFILLSTIIYCKTMDNNDEKYVSASISGLDNVTLKTESEDDVLSVYEASRYLLIESEDLENIIQNGNSLGMPYVKIKDEYIFSKSALDEWFIKACNQNK